MLRTPILLATSLLGALALSGLAGCATTAPEAPRTTAAHVRFVAEAPAPPPTTPTPAGELVCTARDPFGVTSELWITRADAPAGTLRERTPSGVVRDAPLRVERQGTVLVVDDARSPSDLVAHTATWTTVRGKSYLRRGGRGEPWAPCS